MKEHEIHINTNYMTSGGAKGSNCFIEYVTAKNSAETEQIKAVTLKVAGYYNIEIDTMEV